MSTVYVFGNGLSIAFRPEQFLLPNLTRRVRDLLVMAEWEGRGSAWSELRRIVSAVSPDELSSGQAMAFEQFAGPLERLAEGVRALSALLPAGGPQDQAALQRLESTAKATFARVVGAVLTAVTELPPEGDWTVLRHVARHVVDATPNELQSHVFTLNYDALLDSALLSLRDARRSTVHGFDISDEFDGRSPSMRQLGANSVKTWRWRTDPPSAARRTIRLHHLHGGANWLRGSDGIRKARLDDVRGSGLYAGWIAGQATPFEPAVVLGDSKQRLVAREPFGTAYDELQLALRESERVVVAGYGFGDVPLNRALGRYLRPTTTLTVVNPSNLNTLRIARKLELDRSRIRLIREGLPQGLDEVE